MDVVCRDISKEWAETGIEQLQDYAAVIVIASRALFEQPFTRRLLDNLFEGHRNVYMVRRNMTVKELISVSGRRQSLDADAMRTEILAENIHAKIAHVQVPVVEQGNHQNEVQLRRTFGERQYPDAELPTSTLNHHQYQYDAFICFNSAEEQWVKEELVFELRHMGLKVCVHYENFVVGKPIIDNIIDAIENSKNVLFVISEGFCRSGWCGFEMTYTITLVLNSISTGERPMETVVPIVYEEGTSLPKALRHLTAIHKHNQEFWSILKKCLREQDR